MGQIIRLPSGRHVLDTGKVRIGILAKPPVRDMGSQAELIQAALLNKHVKGASGAMDLRRLADAPTLKARHAYDEAFDTRIEPWSFPHFADAIRKAHHVERSLKDEPVVYLDNGLCARFMRAVDRVLARVWR
jgi:hypothetical protein